MGVSGVDLSTLRGYWQAEGAGGGVPGAGGPDDFACPEDKKNPTRLLKDLQKRLKQDKHYLTSPNNVITRRTMCKDLDILILRENGMRRGKRTEIVDSAAEVDDFLWFFESRVLCEIDAEIAEIGTPDDLDAQGRQISYYTSKLIIFLKLIESLRVAGCYYARQKNTVKANEKFNEALQIAQALINGTAGSSPLARAAAQTRTFLIEKKVWTDKLGSFGYNDDRMRAVLGGVYKEMGRYSEAIAQYRLVVGAGGHQLQSGGYYDYLAESAVSLMECHDSIGAVLRKDRKMLEARGQYDAALSTISLVQAEINRNLVEGFAPDGETPLASAEFVVRFAEAACYAYLGQADCTADAALKKELQEKAIQLSTLYNATLAACRAGNGAAKVRELLEALGFNSAAHPHVFSRVPDIAAAIAKKGKKIDYNQFGTEIEQLGIEIRNALKSKDADKLTATIAKLVALLNNRKLLDDANYAEINIYWITRNLIWAFGSRLYEREIAAKAGNKGQGYRIAIALSASLLGDSFFTGALAGLANPPFSSFLSQCQVECAAFRTSGTDTTGLKNFATVVPKGRAADKRSDDEEARGISRAAKDASERAKEALALAGALKSLEKIEADTAVVRRRLEDAKAIYDWIIAPAGKGDKDTLDEARLGAAECNLGLIDLEKKVNLSYDTLPETATRLQAAQDLLQAAADVSEALSMRKSLTYAWLATVRAEVATNERDKETWYNVAAAAYESLLSTKDTNGRQFYDGLDANDLVIDDLYYRLGETYKQLNDYARALKTFDLVNAATYRFYFLVQIGRAEILAARQEEDDVSVAGELAQETFRQVSIQETDLSRYSEINLGEVYFRLGGILGLAKKYDSAIEAFKKIPAYHLQYPFAQIGLAEAYVGRGKVASSDSDMRAAKTVVLLLYEDAYGGRGVVAQLRGVALGKYYVRLGDVLKQLEEYEKAIWAFDKVPSTHVSYPLAQIGSAEAYAGLARVQSKAGKKTEAEQAIVEAKKKAMVIFTEVESRGAAGELSKRDKELMLRAVYVLSSVYGYYAEEKQKSSDPAQQREAEVYWKKLLSLFVVLVGEEKIREIAAAKAAAGDVRFQKAQLNALVFGGQASINPQAMSYGDSELQKVLEVLQHRTPLVEADAKLFFTFGEVLKASGKTNTVVLAWAGAFYHKAADEAQKAANRETTTPKRSLAYRARALVAEAETQVLIAKLLEKEEKLEEAGQSANEAIRLITEEVLSESALTDSRFEESPEKNMALVNAFIILSWAYSSLADIEGDLPGASGHFAMAAGVYEWLFYGNTNVTGVTLPDYWNSAIPQTRRDGLTQEIVLIELEYTPHKLRYNYAELLKVCGLKTKGVAPYQYDVTARRTAMRFFVAAAGEYEKVRDATRSAHSDLYYSAEVGYAETLLCLARCQDKEAGASYREAAAALATALSSDDPAIKMRAAYFKGDLYGGHTWPGAPANRVVQAEGAYREVLRLAANPKIAEALTTDEELANMVMEARFGLAGVLYEQEKFSEALKVYDDIFAALRGGLAEASFDPNSLSLDDRKFYLRALFGKHSVYTWAKEDRIFSGKYKYSDWEEIKKQVIRYEEEIARILESMPAEVYNPASPRYEVEIVKRKILLGLARLDRRVYRDHEFDALDANGQVIPDRPDGTDITIIDQYDEIALQIYNERTDQWGLNDEEAPKLLAGIESAKGFVYSQTNQHRKAAEANEKARHWLAGVNPYDVGRAETERNSLMNASYERELAVTNPLYSGRLLFPSNSNYYRPLGSREATEGWGVEAAATLGNFTLSAYGQRQNLYRFYQLNADDFVYTSDLYGYGGEVRWHPLPVWVDQSKLEFGVGARLEVRELNFMVDDGEHAALYGLDAYSPEIKGSLAYTAPTSDHLVQGASGDIILNPLCSRGSLYAEPGTEDRYQTLWGWRVQGFYNFKVMWEKYLKFLGTGPSGSVGLGLAEDPQGRTAGGFWALDGSARVAGLSGNFSNVFYLGPVPVKASFNWSVPLRFITPEAGWNGVLDTTVLLEPLTKKWGAWQYILPSAVGAEFSGFSDDQNRSGERQIKLYWGR